MAATTEHTTLSVALIGNPNTGKSTLFGALSGIRQRVGNYPGVTVEKKIGHLDAHGRRFELIDLPGTYSLAPRSPDEMVAVDVLLGRQADVRPVGAVLAIVDASNLERNLYLVSQILELGLPTVVALNMVDLARGRGLEIDVLRLRERLGVPVIEVQANRRIGIAEVTQALADVAGREAAPPPSPFPEAFQREVAQLQTALGGDWLPKAHSHGSAVPRYLVERLLLDSSGYLQQSLLPSANGEVQQAIVAARERLATLGCPVPAVEAVARYGWVGKILEGVIRRPERRVVTRGDRLDTVLTNKFWGTAIFALLMAVVFSAVFVVADVPMKWIEAGVEQLGSSIEGFLPEGALRSLVVDGVIAGVGSVLVFLPQILILFFFIGVLEDCGYMARAAYLMDKLMVRVGLSGKSFIPLLSSFACAVPGIMATRVIENRRDRLTTILVAPLMSCSARLPVYTILIGAFIPARKYLGGVLQLQGLTLFAMYAVGMMTAAVVALLLKRTLLRGPTPAFVMELPAYKWPSAAIVGHRMLDRGWTFIHRAGTLILAVAVLIWAASYYPHDAAQVEAPFAARQAALDEQLAQAARDPDRTAALEVEKKNIENEISGAYQRQSYLGRVGKAIEPIVRPLGWDWRIGCAAIASFPAREVVVGTLGVIYNLGRDIKAEKESGTEKLTVRLQSATWDGTDRPVYNIPVALSIMVFFALCAQCASTLVIIRRETNSWRWPIFTFTYMTTLAYVGAFLTYQIGMLISGGS